MGGEQSRRKERAKKKGGRGEKKKSPVLDLNLGASALQTCQNRKL